jgi:hypothetical protein
MQSRQILIRETDFSSFLSSPNPLSGPRVLDVVAPHHSITQSA